MEQIILNGTIFLVGTIFGAGSFYGLVLARLNGQKEFNKQMQEQFTLLNHKLDEVKCDIIKLTERIARIEGKINGKLT